MTLVSDHELRPTLESLATSIVFGDVMFSIRADISQDALVIHIAGVRSIVTALRLHPFWIFVCKVPLDIPLQRVITEALSSFVIIVVAVM